MKPAQLLLAYQRLVEKERELRDQIEQVESLLASDPNIAHAEEALANARAAQQAYLRVRTHPPVAEVDHNQCLACHVTVTSSGMQALRKGEDIVHCDNCGRILVIA